MKDKLKQKHTLVSILAIFVFLISILFVFIENEGKRIENPEAVTASGFAPTIATSNVQTNRYDVESDAIEIPGGAYIFQQEKKENNPKPSDLVWIANTVVGDVEMKNLANNVPVKTKITAPLDMNNYRKPTEFHFIRNGDKERKFNANVLNVMDVKDKTKDGKPGIKFLKGNSYGWDTATAKSVGGTKIHATYELVWV